MADLRIAGVQGSEELVHVVDVVIAFVFGLLEIHSDLFNTLQLVPAAVVVAAVKGALLAHDEHAASGHIFDAPLVEHFLRRLVA